MLGEKNKFKMKNEKKSDTKVSQKTEKKKYEKRSKVHHTNQNKDELIKSCEIKTWTYRNETMKHRKRRKKVTHTKKLENTKFE